MSKLKETPILFSTEMVQAIITGNKRQTRRTKGLELLNQRPKDFTHHGRVGELWTFHDCTSSNTDNKIFQKIKCPYGKPGDLIWVRETYTYVLWDHAPDLLEGSRSNTQFVYKASVHEDWMEYAKEKYGYKWTPSIYMPKVACRIWLEITDVRIERLRDISEKDAISEGLQIFRNFPWAPGKPFYKDYNDKGFSTAENPCYEDPIDSFESLWDSINGGGSFLKNPFVWVISFKVVKK